MAEDNNSEKRRLINPTTATTQYDTYTVPLGGDPNSSSSNNNKKKKLPLKATSLSAGDFMNLQQRQKQQQQQQQQQQYGNMRRKAHSIHAVSEMGYLTPYQLGRKELYELVPMTAVFGLQRMERKLSEAFAHHVAEDTMEEIDKGHKLSKVQRQEALSSRELEILDEFETEKMTVTIPLIFAVFVAALAQFLVGYNIGVLNTPEPYVFPGHSTGSWALAVAAFAVGGPIGANVAGSIADKRGRRAALLLNSWMFLVGGLMFTFALDMWTLIISRIIIGLASGFSTVIVPIYLGELAPPTLRGTLGTLTQFALVIGILVSDLFAFPLSNEKDWKWLFSVTIFVAAGQLLCAPFLLESPRWLLSRNPDSRKGRYILKKLRGFHNDYEVDMEAELMISAGETQSINDNSNAATNISPMKQLIADKNVRPLLIGAIVLQMAQQLCGINAVFYYSNSFFDGVIDNPLIGTTLVGAVNVVATYVALLLMDSCGRKTLILWSSGGMLMCVIIIVLALKGIFGHVVALVAVNGYVSFFEIGLGPIPWLIVAEMFDAKYVSVAMSLCCQVNWTCNIIVGLVFPFLNKYLGPYSFGPFGIVLFLTIVYSFFLLPETQGKTPEELQKEWMKDESNSELFKRSIVASPQQALTNPVAMEWRKAMQIIQKEEEEAMKAGSYDYGFQSSGNNE